MQGLKGLSKNIPGDVDIQQKELKLRP